MELFCLSIFSPTFSIGNFPGFSVPPEWKGKRYSDTIFGFGRETIEGLPPQFDWSATTVVCILILSILILILIITAAGTESEGGNERSHSHTHKRINAIFGG